MLTASTPAPKPQQWRGVQEGLEQAKVYLRQKQPQQACRALEEILEFAPSEARAWHLLGRIKKALGQHQEALQCLQRANTLYPKKISDTEPKPQLPDSLRTAKILHRQGDEDDAIQMIKRLLANSDPEQEQHEELQQCFIAWKNIIT